jgi:hypothetical protein
MKADFDVRLRSLIHDQFDTLQAELMNTPPGNNNYSNPCLSQHLHMTGYHFFVCTTKYLTEDKNYWQYLRHPPNILL